MLSKIAALLSSAALTIALALASGPAQAQYPGPPAAYRGRTPLYHPVYRVPTQPQPQPTGDSPAAFIAALNGYRAMAGRPPLAWDATLAAWASRNGAGHTVMAPGASQVWAGCGGYLQALEMWRGSPSHWVLLMGAGTSIGVAVNGSGVTANAR